LERSAIRASVSAGCTTTGAPVFCALKTMSRSSRTHLLHPVHPLGVTRVERILHRGLGDRHGCRHEDKPRGGGHET
jgi:hypothetical protein